MSAIEDATKRLEAIAHLTLFGHPGGSITIDNRHQFGSDLRAVLEAARPASPPAPQVGEELFIPGHFNDRVEAGDRLDPVTGKIVNVATPPAGGGGEALATCGKGLGCARCNWTGWLYTMEDDQPTVDPCPSCRGEGRNGG